MAELEDASTNAGSNSVLRLNLTPKLKQPCIAISSLACNRFEIQVQILWRAPILLLSWSNGKTRILRSLHAKLPLARRNRHRFADVANHPILGGRIFPSGSFFRFGARLVGRKARILWANPVGPILWASHRRIPSSWHQKLSLDRVARMKVVFLGATKGKAR